MTAQPITARAAPAILGGAPAFPAGLSLVRPTISDVPAVMRRIEAVLDSGILTNGPTVRALEDTVTERIGVPAVAVASCTSGLMLVLQAVNAHGPVVMPSFTFSASAHAVVWAGGRPVWADVDPDRLTLDPDDAGTAMVDGVVAMTATHVYGAPCQIERLQRLADERRIPLVYDAAHGLGSRRRGRPVGSFGTAEVFSLSPTKVAVAGEGGLVTTSDGALADAVRIGRDYGNPGDYNCLFPGLNARMSELHAAVALESLRDLDDRVTHRNALVRVFRAATAGLPGLAFQHVDDGDVSTYKDLTLVIDPDTFGLTVPQLAAALRADGVDTRRYYSPPVHRQAAYAGIAAPRSLPVTDRVAQQVLTLPLWSHMQEATITKLADTVIALHMNAAAVAKTVPTEDDAAHHPGVRLGGRP